MSVLDGDFPEKHVMSFKHIIVVNAPVEWESHGFVVWVFLVESTAVRQRVLVDILGAVVVSLVLLKVSDHDKHVELHSFRGSLGEQHAVGVAAVAIVLVVLQRAGCELFLQLAEAFGVWNGSTGLCGFPHNDVVSSMKLMSKSIQLHHKPSLLVVSERCSEVVGHGSQEDSDDTCMLAIAVHLDVVAEVVMVQPLNLRLDINISLSLAVVQSVVQIKSEEVEVGVKLIVMS